jgi:hypothetical protein
MERIRNSFNQVKPMKHFLLLLFTLFCTTSAYEEQCFPNLKVPTNLSPGNIEASVQHRFYGRIDTGGTTFFGLATSVFASFGLRYDIWRTLEATAAFYNTNKELETGVSYAFLNPSLYLKVQAEAVYYNFSARDTAFKEFRKQAGCVLFDLQTYQIIQSISPVVNVGYDFDKRRWGLGCGLNATLIEGLDVFGEYFPIVHKDRNDSIHTKNAFSFGVKVSTAGHHFLFFLQNSVYDGGFGTIGSRHLMFGSDNNKLHFGFEIQRMFAF